MVHHGLNIKKLVASSKLSAKAIAKKLEVTPSSMTTTYKTKTINGDKLKKFAEILNVDVSEIISETSLDGLNQSEIDQLAVLSDEPHEDFTNPFSNLTKAETMEHFKNLMNQLSTNQEVIKELISDKRELKKQLKDCESKIEALKNN